VYNEADAWNIVGERAANLFLGGHYAFLVWLDGPKFGTPAFGSGMFASFAKILGTEFYQGNYEIVEIPFGSTNIFLWYRGAIEDFGYGFIIFPLLCGYSIKSFGNRHRSRIGLVAVMFGIQLILYPFYSPLYFTVFAMPFLSSILFLPLRRVPTEEFFT
jgi:hypothetical protein